VRAYTLDAYPHFYYARQRDHVEQARATGERFARLGQRPQPLGWDEGRGRVHLPEPRSYRVESAKREEDRYLASLETEKPTVQIAPPGAINLEWQQLQGQAQLTRKRAREDEEEKSQAFFTREGRERERENEASLNMVRLLQAEQGVNKGSTLKQLKTDEELARKLTRAWA
jgi:hypothetical protein